MKDDWYIKNLAKIFVCVVILIARYLEKCFTKICRALYRDAVLVPFRGAPTEHGSCKVTETSVIEFWNQNEKLFYSSHTLKLDEKPAYESIPI